MFVPQEGLNQNENLLILYQKNRNNVLMTDYDRQKSYLKNRTGNFQMRVHKEIDRNMFNVNERFGQYMVWFNGLNGW